MGVCLLKVALIVRLSVPRFENFHGLLVLPRAGNNVLGGLRFA